jgi:hypothetical protein
MAELSREGRDNSPLGVGEVVFRRYSGSLMGNRSGEWFRPRAHLAVGDCCPVRRNAPDNKSHNVTERDPVRTA